MSKVRHSNAYLDYCVFRNRMPTRSLRRVLAAGCRECHGAKKTVFVSVKECREYEAWMLQNDEVRFFMYDVGGKFYPVALFGMPVVPKESPSDVL